MASAPAGSKTRQTQGSKRPQEPGSIMLQDFESQSAVVIVKKNSVADEEYFNHNLRKNSIPGSVVSIQSHHSVDIGKPYDRETLQLKIVTFTTKETCAEFVQAFNSLAVPLELVVNERGRRGPGTEEKGQHQQTTMPQRSLVVFCKGSISSSTDLRMMLMDWLDDEDGITVESVLFPVTCQDLNIKDRTDQDCAVITLTAEADLTPVKGIVAQNDHEVLPMPKQNIGTGSVSLENKIFKKVMVGSQCADEDALLKFLKYNYGVDVTLSTTDSSVAIYGHWIRLQALSQYVNGLLGNISLANKRNAKLKVDEDTIQEKKEKLPDNETDPGMESSELKAFMDYQQWGENGLAKRSLENDDTRTKGPVGITKYRQAPTRAADEEEATHLKPTTNMPCSSSNAGDHDDKQQAQILGDKTRSRQASCSGFQNLATEQSADDYIVKDPDKEDVPNQEATHSSAEFIPLTDTLADVGHPNLNGPGHDENQGHPGKSGNPPPDAYHNENRSESPMDFSDDDKGEDQDKHENVSQHSSLSSSQHEEMVSQSQHDEHHNHDSHPGKGSRLYPSLSHVEKEQSHTDEYDGTYDPLSQSIATIQIKVPRLHMMFLEKIHGMKNEIENTFDVTIHEDGYAGVQLNGSNGEALDEASRRLKEASERLRKTENEMRIVVRGTHPSAVAAVIKQMEVQYPNCVAFFDSEDGIIEVMGKDSEKLTKSIEEALKEQPSVDMIARNFPVRESVWIFLRKFKEKEIKEIEKQCKAQFSSTKSQDGLQVNISSSQALLHSAKSRIQDLVRHYDKLIYEESVPVSTSATDVMQHIDEVKQLNKEVVIQFDRQAAKVIIIGLTMCLRETKKALDERFSKAISHTDQTEPVSGGARKRDLPHSASSTLPVDRPSPNVTGSASQIVTRSHDTAKRSSSGTGSSFLYEASTPPVTCKLSKFDLAVHILEYDITKMKVDAIVIATDNYLQHKFGVSKVVMDAAGSQVIEECKQTIKFMKGLAVGESYISQSGELNCKNIIHVSCPVRRTDDKKLEGALLQALKDADMRKYSVIAFPPILAGLLGRDAVAGIFAGAFKKFCNDRRSANLKHIYLVDINAETVIVLQKAIGSLRQFNKLREFLGENPAQLRLKKGSSDDGHTKPHHRQASGGLAAVGHGSSSSEFSGSAADDGASDGPASGETCVICLDDIPVKKLKTLPCKHSFCNTCIDKSLETKPACPICGKIFGQLKGDQPYGEMKVKNDFSTELPGFAKSGTIVISYDIRDGTQTDKHPTPGRRFRGLRRKAYLPDNTEGRKVLRLLRKAFDAKLTFTVGRSVTTGQGDRVTWNDIHHKTNTHGGPAKFGYPDPGYLSRVQGELAAKGITE